MVKLTFSFSKPGQHFTWDDANNEAKKKGARLPTIKELSKYIKKNGGYALYPGQDVWVPVQGKNGKKDWCQAGDKHHKPGKSHVLEQGGYPTWGDDSSSKNSHAFNDVLCVVKDKVSCTTCGDHYTWEGAKKAARKAGGRLPTTKEAKKWLKFNGGVCKGQDAWAACITKDGKKDWIQIGDKHHYPGKSHVKEQGGYPTWGDDESAKDGYGFNTYLLVYKSNYHAEKTSEHHTWDSGALACIRKGGRLLTIKEAKEYFSNNPGFDGVDAWAPVLGKNGKKDWVQVGNKHHKPGKSHVEEQGGYPTWGDDANSKNNYGFNTYLVWQ